VLIFVVGDVAVLLSAGWSTKKVIIFQIISQATAFVGLYLAIGVANETDNAQQWIFAIASGMFLYIALANIVSETLIFLHTPPLGGGKDPPVERQPPPPPIFLVCFLSFNVFNVNLSFTHVYTPLTSFYRRLPLISSS